MKVPFKNIEGFVKKPPAETMAILVYGPDEGLVRERLNALTKNIVQDVNDPFNVVELSGDGLIESPSRLLDEAQSISMLGGRRVVRLREASDKASSIIKDTLAALKEGDNLILVEAGELNPRSTLRTLFEGAGNAAALPCYVDDERDISRVIQTGLKEKGLDISSEALVHMAQNVVGDRGVARSEIEKISIYMGSHKNISIDDAIACVGSSASLPLDGLCKAAASGQFAEAERVLATVLSEGLPAVTVLRALQTYFTRLYVTKTRVTKGDDIETATRKLRPEVFWKNKAAFESQVYGWPAEQLEQVVSLLVSVEGKCKQTGSSPETLCSRAILSISQMAARATKRRKAV